MSTVETLDRNEMLKEKIRESPKKAGIPLPLTCVSAPICNVCSNLKSLPGFVIFLAPICNLCTDLKSLTPDLKSLP